MSGITARFWRSATFRPCPEHSPGSVIHSGLASRLSRVPFRTFAGLVVAINGKKRISSRSNGIPVAVWSLCQCIESAWSHEIKRRIAARPSGTPAKSLSDWSASNGFFQHLHKQINNESTGFCELLTWEELHNSRDGTGSRGLALLLHSVRCYNLALLALFVSALWCSDWPASRLTVPLVAYANLWPSGLAPQKCPRPIWKGDNAWQSTMLQSSVVDPVAT